MHPTRDAKVILRHCDSYDPQKIRAIVRDAIREVHHYGREGELLDMNAPVVMEIQVTVERVAG